MKNLKKFGLSLLVFSLFLIGSFSLATKAQAAAPTISSGFIDATNSYVDVTFSEGVYGNALHTIPVNAGSFAPNFVQHAGTATNTTITNVRKTTGAVLTGGETTVRVYLTVTGTPSGVETVEIKPFGAASIYNFGGEAMSATESTFTIGLNPVTTINTATNTQVTPGTQFDVYRRVPVYRLNVSNAGTGADTITALSPTPSGSAVDTLVTLHFYNDANNNGVIDLGDTDLGASALFGSNDTIQTFDIADVPVPAGGSAHILITADGDSVANNTLLFNLSFAAGTGISMAGSAVDTAGYPKLNTDALTITTTVPSVTIADATNNPVSKTVAVGATNVVVKRLAIIASSGTSDSIVSIAPTPTGTANDNLDITSVDFYIDNGTPGVLDGADVHLETTPATYTGNDAQTIFTFSAPFQVAASSTINILIVYNLTGGIAPGSTLYTFVAAVGDVIAGSGTALTGDSSTTSSLITIASGTADITVISSKVTSSNTVLVTLNNPTHNLASVDFTKWHIDVGDGGGSPLDPVSANIISAVGPFTINLTFSGTPFSNTATAYSAAEGLYVDATGVTDTNGDTNVVVGNAASTIITDGQSPTGTVALSDAVTKIGNTTQTVTVTYNEQMAATHPTIAFNHGTFVSNSDGAWSDLTHYHESFTDSSSEEFPVVTVSSSGATDIALNIENTSTHGLNNPFILDTIAPTVTINTPAVIKIANKTAYTLTGTCSENGNTVIVTVTGIAPFTPICGGLVWTTGAQNVSAAVDNLTLAITADHIDVAGNNATQAVSATVKDTVAPIGTVAVTSTIVKLGSLNQTVAVTYGEPMDGASTPIFSFDHGTFVSSGAGVWSGAGNTTFTQTFHSTVLEQFPAVTVSTSGATDATGNTESSSALGVNNPFVLDTLAPTAPTAVSITPVGGILVTNTLNGTNTNMTATATIIAGEATGGSAVLKVGSTTLATDAIILIGDTTTTFTLGTGSTAALQAAVVAGGTITVTLIDSVGNSTVSAVGNPTLVVDYIAPTFTVTSISPVSGNTAKVGDHVIVTLTAGSLETGLTASGTQTINGVTSTFTEVGLGIYTIDYLVAEGNTDIADSAALPVNITFKDPAGNIGTTITTIASGTAPGIDANSPATPTSSLGTGTYSTSQTTTLASTGSTSIRFTVDGSTPTCSYGTVYSGTISINISETIKAIGCDNTGNLASNSFNYSIYITGGGNYFYSAPVVIPGVTPTPVVTPIIPITPAIPEGCNSTTAFSPVTGQSCGSVYVAPEQTDQTISTTPTVQTTTQQTQTNVVPAGTIQTIKVNLSLGTTSPMVRILQKFLINQNKGLAAKELGTHGTTLNFATLTKSALIEWQKSVGVIPASGYFGPITRTKIKILGL